MGGDTQLLTRRRVVLALILLVVAAAVIFIWQAVSASRALLDARDRAERVETLIRAGDFGAATDELDRLQEQTEQARDSTDGVLWDIGRHVPFLGRNLGAVQTVAEVLDTATARNAPIALQLTQALDAGTFRPVRGKIDIEEIGRLAPTVAQAAAAIDEAAVDLDDLNADSLVFPFNDLVGDLQDRIDAARSAANASSTAFDLLPQMLGGSKPRTYLLMIQNPAELRSTGGLPGSLALLRAVDGRVTMGWQGSAGEVNGFTKPVVKLPEDSQQQYGTSPATDFRDLNFTPDFPEAAQIARAMIADKRGVKVDGVVSIDPIALGFLLGGTGPVDLGGGVGITADNVADTLLNKTYQRFSDPIAQDDFFKLVARKVFDAVMGGQGDQQQSIRALATGTEQHRVLLWSARGAEQRRLTGTAVAGELGGVPEDVPQVGVYLNDSTAGKMDYYLDYRTAVSAVECRNDKTQDLRASVSLASTMPRDYSGLSVWILGTGEFAPQGTIAFNLRLYAPRGGEIVGLSVDGVQRSVTADRHDGRQVALVPLALRPGQRAEVTADIRTAPGQTRDGIFSFTPGMLPAPNGVRFSSACD